MATVVSRWQLTNEVKVVEMIQRVVFNHFSKYRHQHFERRVRLLELFVYIGANARQHAGRTGDGDGDGDGDSDANDDDSDGNYGIDCKQ